MPCSIAGIPDLHELIEGFGHDPAGRTFIALKESDAIVCHSRYHHEVISLNMRDRSEVTSGIFIGLKSGTHGYIKRFKIIQCIAHPGNIRPMKFCSALERKNRNDKVSLSKFIDRACQNIHKDVFRSKCHHGNINPPRGKHVFQ